VRARVKKKKVVVAQALQDLKDIENSDEQERLKVEDKKIN